MYFQPKVEPILFQQERIQDGRIDYTVYTYWVQLEPATYQNYYESMIPINYKDLEEDGCYLIESAEEITMSSIIIL